jgi:hypothetical protein
VSALGPRPLEYLCPICGKKAAFGSHFCEGQPAPQEERGKAEQAKRIGVAAVGLAMIAALLWGMIGAYSLYSFGALALAAAATAIIRAARRRRRDDTAARFPKP